MPIAPVPMGSGNGSSLNLLGKAVGSLTLLQRESELWHNLRSMRKDAKDIAMAALNAIKGTLVRLFHQHST